jgi:two-component system, OmpR family, sensor kinase
MSAAAAGISAANLSTRIDAAAVDVELAGLAQVLNAMLGRIEAAFQRQQQFTADASHELRTPLAILRTNAELALSQSRSAAEYRQTIEACLRAADRMSTLVQGLLTLARADAGDPGMQFQAVLFEQIVADCLTALQPLAEEKKITLTAELMPAEVLGDPNSLAQLVNNLLGNAIQHNHVAGSAHVRVASSAGDAILTVSNTGPGISEADRRRVFERFFRVDKARTRASGGTGLGLAICKAIVEAHRGAIDCEKSDGDETVFHVTLPLAKATAN